MSVDRARAELAPLLSAMVEKLKDERDTTNATSGFGMRTEYYLKAAVFGLIRSSEPGTSYLVKVLVPYEKFVVSSTGSKSYGKDTERFCLPIASRSGSSSATTESGYRMPDARSERSIRHPASGIGYEQWNTRTRHRSSACPRRGDIRRAFPVR